MNMTSLFDDVDAYDSSTGASAAEMRLNRLREGGASVLSLADECEKILVARVSEGSENASQVKKGDYDERHVENLVDGIGTWLQMLQGHSGTSDVF